MKKKEIIISDIDLLAVKSEYYSDNPILYLLNSYPIEIGSKKNAPSEFMSINFLVDQGDNQLALLPDLATQQKLIENINKSLSDSYYYALSKFVNNNTNNILLKYGKTYYNYSTSLLQPLSVPLDENEQKISESGVLIPIAKFQPFYNYYNESYEKVSVSDLDDTSLFNFYSLYHYLNEQNTEKSFLDKNVFDLLKNYDDAFLSNYLASTKVPILSELKKYKNSNTTVVKKDKVYVTPQAFKSINEITNFKLEQPFGIEISFPSQPASEIANIIKGTSYGIQIEKLILEQESKAVNLSDRVFPALVSFENDETISNIQKENSIKVFDMNTFFDDVQPQSVINDNDLIIDSTLQKESPFLEKIKQQILKEKINELIDKNGRSFTDIVFKKDAYKEVLFYEIQKYDAIFGKLIQKIILPNTNESEIIRYFDTQVKYQRGYAYKIIAWTMIIGNKYKYFDRITTNISSNLVPAIPNVEDAIKDNPEIGLPTIVDAQTFWYPRPDSVINNNKIQKMILQFGVYNEPDIILAGIPYAQGFSSVLSAPPVPPEVTFVPYKNVKNKIKILFNNLIDKYREKPILINSDDSEYFNKFLEQEALVTGIQDGKITFASDEPVNKFEIFKLDFKPKSYEDFATKSTELVVSEDGYAIEEKLEPNKKYYYTFRSVDLHGAISNPTSVYEVEVVDNSGAIYPIINIVEFEKYNPRVPIKSFANQFRLKVDPEHILEKEKLTTAQNLNKDLFGSKAPGIFGKSFKIRITSKTTKRKMDINVSFDQQFKQSIVD